MTGGSLASGFRRGPEPAYRHLQGRSALPSIMRVLGRTMLIPVAFMILGQLIYGASQEGRSALVGSLGFGVVGGAAGFSAVVALQWTRPAFAAHRAQSPRRDLRIHFYRFVRNLAVGACTGAAASVGAASIVKRLFGIEGDWYYTVGLGLLGGTAIGVVVANSWLGYTIAHVWLALRRKVPWRLAVMLEDAHRIGLLRQVGIVYEFRHQKLFDNLASRNCYRERNRFTTPIVSNDLPQSRTSAPNAMR